jgi:periplasmic copper chaperone A
MNACRFLPGLLLLVLVPAAVQAGEPASIEFRAAWIRAAPPVSEVQAGYVDIVNRGATAVTITHAESAVFGAVEMHEMRTVEGMMRMRPLAELPIAAGQTVALAPGGTHLMLMKPVRALPAGEQAEIVFVLADGSRHRVRFDVRPANSTH